MKGSRRSSEIRGAGGILNSELSILNHRARRFAYADCRVNRARFIGSPFAMSHGAGMGRYLAVVESGASEPLDFTLFIPKAMARLLEEELPNVTETDDRSLMFTLHLADGSEVLPGEAPFARARKQTRGA